MAESPAPLALLAETRWGASCLAYNVQIDLTPAAIEAIVRLQQNLAQVLDVPLRRTPPDTLHVSVYAFAPYHWQSPHKEAYWRARATACTDALARIAATHAPTSLCFRELEVHARAVILVASDPGGLLGAARAALRAVADPEVPTPAYDRVHTTVARFAAPGVLDAAALRDARVQRVCIRSDVTALRVVRERIYPSLALDDVATIPLTG